MHRLDALIQLIQLNISHQHVFINPPLNNIFVPFFFICIPSCQFILLKFNVASKRQQLLGCIIQILLPLDFDKSN